MERSAELAFNHTPTKKNVAVMDNIATYKGWQKVFVVFSGETNLWWLKMLKSGFKHCFVSLYDNGQWVIVDPMAHRTEIAILSVSEGFDLISWYKSKGMTVVETEIKTAVYYSAPFGFFSCVEAVKRVLGIHKRGIYSPYKLYLFLKKKENGKKSLTFGNK